MPKTGLAPSSSRSVAVEVADRFGVARPVRQKDTVGLEREHLCGARGRRNDRDRAAGLGEPAQDVVLDPRVHRHDVERGARPAARRCPRAGRRREPALPIGRRSRPPRRRRDRGRRAPRPRAPWPRSTSRRGPRSRSPRASRRARAGAARSGGYRGLRSPRRRCASGSREATPRRASSTAGRSSRGRRTRGRRRPATPCRPR